MNRIAIALAGTACLTGCSAAPSEDEVEDSLRDYFAKQGELRSLDVSTVSENQMLASATVASPDGIVSSMRCEIDVSEDGFQYACFPVVDDNVLAQFVERIKADASEFGAVEDVDFAQTGDREARGSLTVIEPSGVAQSVECIISADPQTQQLAYSCR